MWLEEYIKRDGYIAVYWKSWDITYVCLVPEPELLYYLYQSYGIHFFFLPFEKEMIIKAFVYDQLTRKADSLSSVQPHWVSLGCVELI